MKKHLLIIVGLILLLTACGGNNNEDFNAEKNNHQSNEQENNTEEDVIEKESDTEEIIELTATEQMLNDIVDLMDEGLAFDTGSYEKDDVPKGEYVFVKFDGSGSYYSEVDGAGNIIDNENFDSFGYVEVHGAGEIESSGALINIETLDELGVSGAKELFEILNEVEDYNESGHYKVGLDIEPGEYSIESYGSGYVGLMSGPVGNSEIVENDNFNGSYTVTVKEGQYLVVSKAYIEK